MTHEISAANGAGSTSPLAVAGYDAARQSRNIIHDLLDGTIGVSFIAPRPRSGDLVTVYDDAAQAFAALDLYGEECAFTLASSDLTQLGMTFVVDGTIGVEQDRAHPGIWYVLVGYQEV